MTANHDKRRRRVAEPVQVYLAPADQERLARLTAELSATKSDVLRRGLEALETRLARRGSGGRDAPPLPTYRGQGLQAGVDLDDSAALSDLMDRE